MSFRRIPREIDPRRPPKTRKRDESGEVPEPRSYGQYLELTPDEVAELERATGEVAREGASEEGTGEAPAEKHRHHKDLEEREDFEDLTGEVSREDGSSRRR